MAKQMTKKVKIILIAVASVVLVGAVLGLVLGLTLPRRERIVLNNIAVNQIGKEQRINVVWETGGGSVSKVDIVVKKSNGLIDSSVTVSNPSLIAKRSATADASYGKNTVEVTVYNSVNSSKKTTTVDVFTDEYVIAPLVATMPVTLFSLRMSEFTDNYSVPTFVWLQRGAAWNYQQMPDNVYLMPTSTYEVMSSYLGDNVYKMYYETSVWVKELYEINPNSQFHFYVNDYHPFVWLEATYLNRMPKSNYDVTLLTDGTASNSVFESLYANNSTALSDYNNMVREYNDYKQGLWNKNNPDAYNNLISIPLAINRTQKWILPMLMEEPNIKIILTRAYFSGNDEVTDSTIKQYVNELTESGKIEVVSLYNLLNALSEEGKRHVKALYKFGDNVFEKAAEENKTAMVILGTRTINEEHFDAYVAATMAHYGNDYVYYYKGHPWTPTSSDPSKAERLEKMGLIDVDSSIAAELLFFFNPDLVSTGYGSTTFGSLNANQVGGMFGVSLADAKAIYSSDVKFVMNKITKLDPTYGKIATLDCMLLEFADTSKYDVAIYDRGTDTIKYYKKQGSDFVEVSK